MIFIRTVYLKKALKIASEIYTEDHDRIQTLRAVKALLGSDQFEAAQEALEQFSQSLTQIA